MDTYTSSQKTRMLFLGYLAIFPFFAIVTAVTIPLFIIQKLDVSLQAALIATVIGEAIFVLVALLSTDLLPNGWRDTLGLKRENLTAKSVALGSGVGLTLWILLQAFSVGLAAGGLELESSDTSKGLTEGSGVLFYLILLLAVPLIVPFVEEVVFRGIIMGFLLKGHSVEDRKLSTTVWLGPILFSSLMFAVAHIQGFSTFTDLFIFVWIFVVAIVNALIRFKTDSLYTSFASHAVYNGVTSLAVLITLL